VEVVAVEYGIASEGPSCGFSVSPSLSPPAFSHVRSLARRPSPILR
jgi:hypothetical protein